MTEVRPPLKKLAVATPPAATGAPRGIWVDQFGPELTITWYWLTWRVWVCVFWMSFLTIFIVFLPIAAINIGLNVIIAGLLPVPYLIGWLCVAYFLICRLMNQTRVRVVGDRIEVRHGPLPTWGSGTHRLSEIRQLFCAESKHEYRGLHYFSYNLILWKHDGSHQTLISGLDEDQALFIERELEQFLGHSKEAIPEGYQVRPVSGRS